MTEDALERPIRTVDYHTAGEPFRIVTGGVPELEGRTVVARRRWALDHLDEVRRLLVNEPRGHADMYGCFVTPPDDDWADLGVVFFHNEGYSTACGHGTIALVTWAIDSGRIAVEPGSRSVAVTVDVPSGRLACEARLGEDGRVEAVRFRNVPSFVLARDVTVRTSRGLVTLDVAFGGAFNGLSSLRNFPTDNILSWYIRPLFFLPFCWFACSRSGGATGTTRAGTGPTSGSRARAKAIAADVEVTLLRPPPLGGGRRVLVVGGRRGGVFTDRCFLLARCCDLDLGFGLGLGRTPGEGQEDRLQIAAGPHHLDPRHRRHRAPARPRRRPGPR